MNGPSRRFDASSSSYIQGMKNLIICCFLVVLASAGFGQTTPTQPASGSVASVNGQSISSGEYYQRMEFLTDVGTLVGSHLIDLPPGLLTLDRIITERLVLQLADQHHVSPTEAQIDQALRDALTADPNLETNWTQSGRTEDQLRAQYKIDVAKFNLLTEGIIITDQQVQDQYNNHPDLYTIPKLDHLRIIVVKSQADEQKVDADLAAGKAFKDVATADSVDITKVRGGDFGNVPESSLPDLFKTALTGVKIGGTTDWFHGDNAQPMYSMKLLFEDATPGKLLPLTDSLKAQIRHRLMEDQGSVAHDISKELDALRAKSDIQISNPVFANAYKALVKQQESNDQVENGTSPPPSGSSNGS